MSIPTLRCPIGDVVKQDVLGTVFENQMQKLILDPLQSLSASDSCSVIVIDALDECEDGTRMAQLFTSLADPKTKLPHPFHILITSCPEPSIQAIFDQPKIRLATLDLNLQEFKPDADIHTFLEQRLRDIPRVRSGVMAAISRPWPLSDELTSLVKKSLGLFIYASTAVKFIEDKDAIPHKRLEMVLDNDGSWECTDLDKLYTQILSVCPNINHLCLVVGAVILLRTPLSPCNIFSTIHICAYLLRPSGLIGTIT